MVVKASQRQQSACGGSEIERLRRTEWFRHKNEIGSCVIRQVQTCRTFQILCLPRDDGGPGTTLGQPRKTLIS